MVLIRKTLGFFSAASAKHFGHLPFHAFKLHTMRFTFVVIIASRIYLTLRLSSDRMVKEILPAWEKSKKHSVREFLYTLSRPNAPLGQVDDVCLALLDSYERARYGAQVRCEMTYLAFVPKNL